MTSTPSDRNRLIDAFLDGLLEGEERATVEGWLAEDADLRAEVQRQRDVDDALRRLYAPPSTDALVEKLRAAEREADARPASASRWRVATRPLAAAAVIALCALAGWQVWRFVNPAPPSLERAYVPQEWRSMTTVYADEAKEGFTSDWRCDNDEEFADTFRRRFRQPLLLAKLPADTQVVGLSYSNTITQRTLYVAAHVQEQGVLVFIDKAGTDYSETLPPDGSLHLFSRELGRVMLYELSPLPEPHVLDAFYIPRP